MSKEDREAKTYGTLLKYSRAQQEGTSLTYTPAWFACMEGQYWSNLGLNLSQLDWIMTKSVPSEKVVLIGPGRHLLLDSANADNFIEEGRALLVAIEAPELNEKGERVFYLRFCVEEDIDPIETVKEWNEHPGRPFSCLIEKYIYPLVEPHIHAANGRWLSDLLLPAIEPYRKVPKVPKSWKVTRQSSAAASALGVNLVQSDKVLQGEGYISPSPIVFDEFSVPVITDIKKMITGKPLIGGRCYRYTLGRPIAHVRPSAPNTNSFAGHKVDRALAWPIAHFRPPAPNEDSSADPEVDRALA
eukprot:g21735.t1